MSVAYGFGKTVTYSFDEAIERVTVHVEMIEPVAVFQLVGKPELTTVAQDVGERLRRALACV